MSGTKITSLSGIDDTIATALDYVQQMSISALTDAVLLAHPTTHASLAFSRTHYLFCVAYRCHRTCGILFRNNTFFAVLRIFAFSAMNGTPQKTITHPPWMRSATIPANFLRDRLHPELPADSNYGQVSPPSVSTSMQ